MRVRPFNLLVPGLLLLAACDTVDAPVFEEQYVVEAYLVAGDLLPSLRLSRTAPIDAPYDVTDLAVRGAEVLIHLLHDNGTTDESYRLVGLEYRPGLYSPLADAVVLPGRTYALEVVLPEGQGRLSARTRVPEAVGLVQASADTVVYQGPDQLELTVTHHAGAERQRYFIFTTESLNPLEEELTPLARSLYLDGDFTLEDLRVGGSPIVNEANYAVNSDGTITIPLPWIAVAFYGRNLVALNVLDDNLYDFIRSQGVQQGGSTLAPGEIPNVLTRVEGGTGVFGSYVRVAHGVYVARPSGF